MLRSPTHQIQIYNQYGQFVRKFGANILQHPRGVCVDNKGRIIVVECKVAIKDKKTKEKQKKYKKDKETKRQKHPCGVCVDNKERIIVVEESRQ